ncbi:hypothetical protein UFOVP89_46 [uncultured Caudovirales phage]|uniref:Uncharacterized protein n=1 Tax=uncultured Caudovirales phage TaxID=2100421 RepID=A0A6J5KWL0_9CAUD|nr:hypothetical protein UFOVP89_46 [uncultured Caudovirales phage]
MFLLNGKPLNTNTPFETDNGTQYPANWLNLSTEEEKLAIGITWEDDLVRADDRFYWNGDITLPKDLDGLKEQFVAQVKDTAGKMLSQTDWMVIRKVERNIEIPAEIALKRTQIVTEANRLETDINASTNVEELIAVLNTQNWE